MLACFVASVRFLDSDYFWLVTTGRNILANGIPEYNPTFVVDNLPIVIQQWLYCVYLAIVDSIGIIGGILSVLLFAALLFFVCYKLFRLKSSNRVDCLFGAAFCTITAPYVFLARPEIFTLVLLLVQILIQEYVSRHKKYGLLYLIAPLMILEMNCHASLWFMHVLLFIPYFLPILPVLSDSWKPSIQVNKTSMKHGVLSLVVICLVTGINPYGFGLLTYSIKAMLDDVFSVLTPNEILPVTLDFSDANLIPFIAVLCLLVYTITKRKARSSTIYISVGLLTLVPLTGASRCVQFLPIALILLLMDLNMFDNIVILRAPADKIFKAIGYPIVSILVVFAIFGFTYAVNNTASFVDELNFVRVFSSYESNRHAKIFSHCNITSYLEYVGYDNVFLDVRPEIYDYNLTVERNPLRDYEKSYMPIGYLDMNGVRHFSFDTEFFKAIVDFYDFQYVITSQIDLMALDMYISSHPDQFRYICSSDNVVCYEIVRSAL